MPKEYVEDCWANSDVRDKDGNRVPAPPTFRVKIGWNKEAGNAQIATVNEHAPIGTAESGLYVDLDRRGINDLIRHLRRARDQAFGRDE